MIENLKLEKFWIENDRWGLDAGAFFGEGYTQLGGGPVVKLKQDLDTEVGPAQMHSIR